MRQDDLRRARYSGQSLIIASLPSMEFQRVHQQLLQSHHLFEPLSPVQLQELLASSDLVNLDKGAYVFRQGEPAHAFYYLISGCVKIYRLTPEGQEKILEVTNERNTFAEAMMFMDTPNYVATAQAVVPSQLFRFSNKAYLRQLQDNTPLALALLAKLSTRLHQRIDEIETLSLKNATHRVVRYLLTLAAHAPGRTAGWKSRWPSNWWPVTCRSSRKPSRGSCTASATRASSASTAAKSASSTANAWSASSEQPRRLIAVKRATARPPASWRGQARENAHAPMPVLPP